MVESGPKERQCHLGNDSRNGLHRQERETGEENQPGWEDLVIKLGSAHVGGMVPQDNRFVYIDLREVTRIRAGKRLSSFII